jgi:hypothetical protein
MKKAIIISAALLLVVTLSGCGKKIAEKSAEQAAEKALETASGGKADVDVSKDSVSIKTNEGSYQAGTSVSLPDGFPKDVYVIDGTITTAMNLYQGSYTINIQTNYSVNEAYTKYENQFKGSGWTISLNYSDANGKSLMAQKGNLTVTVAIAEQEGKTNVIVTSAEQEDINTP